MGGSESTRQTTVLFADISDSTKLYESAGDAMATEAIQGCLGRMRQAAETAGGRVVKTIGDEIMALFPAPQEAASAAAAMQKAVDALPEVANTKLSVRIGFHTGPVIQRDGDIFGDTVNLAARLVKQANKEQILTSAETAAALGPNYGPVMRELYAIQVKGKAEEVGLCELVWRVGNDTAKFQWHRPKKQVVLRLKYRDKELVRRRDNENLTIGRELDCDLVILDNQVSRHHCTIERRQDKFVLADTSTNGTYVTVVGDTELILHREEFVLRKHGWITFGKPRTDTAEVVEYSVD